MGDVVSLLENANLVDELTRPLLGQKVMIRLRTFNFHSSRDSALNLILTQRQRHLHKIMMMLVDGVRRFGEVQRQGPPIMPVIGS